MKILYVLNSSTPGGMEQHVLDLVDGMVAGGHEVFVWCNGGIIGGWYSVSGAKVIEKNIKYDIDPFYIMDLATFLIEEKIDVIHAHELKAVVNGLIAGSFAKTKIKISHTHTPISQWKVSAFKKWIDKWVYVTLVNLFSTYEIALTPEIMQIKKSEGIKENILYVIPNALNTSRLNSTEEQRKLYREKIRQKYNIPLEAFVFGNLGRLTQEKGLSVLVDSFSKFLNSELFHKSNFYLLMAGGGVLEEALKKQIYDLNIENRVIITGIFDYADLVKYYSAFDIFIFPSLAEGFGIVLMEAMYFGVPTLCSDLPVLLEVGDKTVSYFKTGDPEDLFQKMTSKYKEVSSGDQSLLEQAKQRVISNFSMESFISSYINLYNKSL